MINGILADASVGLPAILIGIGLFAGTMLAGAKRFIVYAALAVAIGGFGAYTKVSEPGPLILAIGRSFLLAD